MISMEQKRELLAKCKSSPIIRHYAFSDKQLWSGQEDILWSVRNNKRTVVTSGNTVGKSFTAADVAMDFLQVNYPARVVTTAPTFSQVEGILWKEIRNYYHQAKFPIGGRILQTELHLKDDWFAEGISTTDVGRFQGRHNENLLVILDEASGVAKEIWEAAEALHYTRILAIGNPLDDSGPFYDAANSGHWHHIKISCEDCVEWQRLHGKIPGLVTQEWIKEQYEMFGRNSPWCQVHVRGEFPEQASDTLISRKWVEDARKRTPKDLSELEEDNTRVVGCDVATKHGENETVIGYRYGHVLKDIKGYFRQGTLDNIARLSLSFVSNKAEFVVVDADGIGDNYAELLEDRHVVAMEFHGGHAYKAMDTQKFKNLRSQFYRLVALKFEKGLYSLSEIGDKEYEILKGQLCAIKVKAPDGLGRLQIETKDDMQARGIKSPDYADTFMMLEYGFWMAKFQDVAAYKFR